MTSELNMAAELQRYLQKDKRQTVSRGNDAIKQLVIPPGMTFDDAHALINQLEQEEKAVVSNERSFSGMAPEVIIAVYRAAQTVYGHIATKEVRTFFGNFPGTKVSLQTRHNAWESLPYGQMSIGGYIDNLSMYVEADGKTHVSAECRKAQEGLMNQFFSEVERILKDEPLYEGQMVLLDFSWKREGKKYDVTKHAPKIVAAPNVTFDQVAFDRSVLSPLKNAVARVTNHAELKSRVDNLSTGILLHGPYGTGKTLATGLISNMATRSGATVFIIKAEDFDHALDSIDHRYPRAVIIVEDVEKVFPISTPSLAQERMIKLGNVLQKNTDYARLFVGVTNRKDQMFPGSLREGRFGNQILVTGPKEKSTIKKFFELYAPWWTWDDAEDDDIFKACDGLWGATIQAALTDLSINAIIEDGTATKDDIIGMLHQRGSNQKDISLVVQQEHPAEKYKEWLFS